MNETQRLKEIIHEQDHKIKAYENARDKVINDCTLYIKFLTDYEMNAELKERLILQFESLRLPLERTKLVKA